MIHSRLSYADAAGGSSERMRLQRLLRRPTGSGQDDGLVVVNVLRVFQLVADVVGIENIVDVGVGGKGFTEKSVEYGSIVAI